jgi:carboxypeptidase PM20D1
MVLFSIIAAIIILIGFLLIKMAITIRRQNKGLTRGDDSSAVLFKPGSDLVHKLSKALTYKTVSNNDMSLVDLSEFTRFQTFIKSEFPTLTNNLEIETFSELAMIFHWKGSDPSLKPVCFIFHYDVVVPGDESAWTHPPFSGHVDDTNIWGRGALDFKGPMISFLCALEEIVKTGFEPERGLYLCLGGDEEVSGEKGAKTISDILMDRGIRFECLFDEGLLIVDGMLPGVSKPIALIGLSEKGHVDFLISTLGEPGHAARPPAKTAIGKLSRAAAAIEDNPSRAKLSIVQNSFLKALVPHVPFYQKLVFANRWLFGAIIKLVFLKDKNTAALVRSTRALTVIRGGHSHNVLPELAEAIVNCRLIPGETISAAQTRLKKIIGKIDAKIVIADEGNANEALPVSSTNTRAYKTMTATIGAVFPEAAIAPFLVTDSTDSKHYEKISDSIYRFFPVTANSSEIAGIHGTDERITITGFMKSIQYYSLIIEKLCGKGEDT